MEEGEQQLRGLRPLPAGEGPLVRTDARRPRGARGSPAPWTARLAAADRRTAVEHCSNQRRAGARDWTICDQ